jgi:threonylcarbamoyladenosine tRNA methylthiotransferase MtaB
VQLGSWGKEFETSSCLSDLVSAILKNTDVPRIRLSSIEPWDVEPELIDLLTQPRLARHLHLPLQSGCAATLRRMARAFTPEKYRDLVDRIRDQIPEIAITTDILTGFPGETQREFQESLDFIRQMRFAAGHVFSYSAREGTPAAGFPDQVPHPVRKERNSKIREVLRSAEESYQKSNLGKELSVLWEQSEDYSDEAWKLTGLTDNYLRVVGKASENLQNCFSLVRVIGLLPDGLSGEIIG